MVPPRIVLPGPVSTHCASSRWKSDSDSGVSSWSTSSTSFSITSISNRVPISLTREDSMDGASPSSIRRETDNERLRIDHHRAVSSPKSSVARSPISVPCVSRSSCSTVENGESQRSGPPRS